MARHLLQGRAVGVCRPDYARTRNSSLARCSLSSLPRCAPSSPPLQPSDPPSNRKSCCCLSVTVLRWAELTEMGVGVIHIRMHRLCARVFLHRWWIDHSVPYQLTPIRPTASGRGGQRVSPPPTTRRPPLRSPATSSPPPPSSEILAAAASLELDLADGRRRWLALLPRLLPRLGLGLGWEDAAPAVVRER